MNSIFLRLNSNDFIKGFVVAVLAAVLTALAQIVNAPGFDFVSFDGMELVRIAIVTGIAYLSKNLLSDEDGRPIGFRLK